MLTQQQMKQAVAAALEANDLEAIEKFAHQSRRVLSILARLAYDKETLVGWRAISATGRAALVFAGWGHDFLRETIRKLLWSLTDESGGIGWSAPELIGEIVSADPPGFADIVPILAEAFSLEEATFRPGILYAFRRIAESHPGMISPYQEIILRGLSEQDPVARIHALELVRVLKGSIDPGNLERITSKVEILRKDQAEAWLYSTKGAFTCRSVGETAHEVYKYLSDT